METIGQTATTQCPPQGYWSPVSILAKAGLLACNLLACWWICQKQVDLLLLVIMGGGAILLAMDAVLARWKTEPRRWCSVALSVLSIRYSVLWICFVFFLLILLAYYMMGINPQRSPLAPLGQGFAVFLYVYLLFSLVTIWEDHRQKVAVKALETLLAPPATLTGEDAALANYGEAVAGYMTLAPTAPASFTTLPQARKMADDYLRGQYGYPPVLVQVASDDFEMVRIYDYYAPYWNLVYALREPGEYVGVRVTYQEIEVVDLREYAGYTALLPERWLDPAPALAAVRQVLETALPAPFTLAMIHCAVFLPGIHAPAWAKHYYPSHLHQYPLERCWSIFAVVEEVEGSDITVAGFLIDAESGEILYQKI